MEEVEIKIRLVKILKYFVEVHKRPYGIENTLIHLKKTIQ